MHCHRNPVILIGWWVIAPASAAALLTGILQALGTAWGLTRHWWVLLKLGLTVLAAAALLVHLQPTSLMAETARRVPHRLNYGDNYGDSAFKYRGLD